MKTPLVVLILATFLITSVIGPIPLAEADEFRLPMPGVMVHLSPPIDPPILKGIKVYPDNPFRFEFILDKGEGELSNDQLKDESAKLIKYFLASLTIPEKDLWVNLSPYEKDRLIPQSFGLTEMGRDLLAEDYMLKQITASLIYPEDGVGKKFWKRIYEEAAKRYGTTNVPVNTFNKVWIVPEKAVVFENAQEGTAYVVESKLKVMLEQDYLSLEKHEGIQSGQARIKDTNKLGSQIVREIVIPELTTEVNENKNFSRLRQVYNSLILATWYKNKIKDSILSQVYSDKKKVAGVNNDDPLEKEKIYQRYLKAFKKGVYNYIKEDVDPVTQETIPRKYFSGGVSLAMTTSDGKTNLKANVDIFTSQNAPSGLLSFIRKITATSLFVVLAAISGVNASGQNSVNESNSSPSNGENQISLHGKITPNPTIEKLLNVLRDKNAPGRDEAARQLGILALGQLSDGKPISPDTSLEDAAKGLYPKLLEEFEKNPNEPIPPANYTSKEIEGYLEAHPEKLKPSADSLQTEFDTIRYLEGLNPRRIASFISVLQQQAGPEDFSVISEFGKLVQESNVELSDSSLYPQNLKSTLDLLENNSLLKGRFTYIENKNEKIKNKKGKSITLILKNGRQAVISLENFEGKAPIDKQFVLNLMLLGGLTFWHSLNLLGERREKKQLLKATQALMISLNWDTQEVEKVFNGSNEFPALTPSESPERYIEEVDNLSRTIEERNITLRGRLNTLVGENLRPFDGVNQYWRELVQDYSNYQILFEEAGKLAQRAPDDASRQYIRQKLQEELITGFKRLYGQRSELEKTLLNFNKLKKGARFVFDTFAQAFTLRLFVDALNSRPSYAPVGYEEPFTTRVKKAVKKSIARGLYTFYLSDINPDEIKLEPAPKLEQPQGFSLLRWHNGMITPQNLQALPAIEELQNPLGQSQAPAKQPTAAVEQPQAPLERSQTPVKQLTAPVEQSPTLSEEKAQSVIVEKKLTAVEKRNQERQAAIRAEFKRIWVDSKGEATTLVQMRAAFRARALPKFYDKRRNLTPEYRSRLIGQAWKSFGGEALIKEFEAENLKQDVGMLGNDVVGEAVEKPDSASLSRREFINKTSLAALFTLALSKYSAAAKLLSPETGLKLEAPSIKASYKEWMSDVLEAAEKLQGSYKAQLKKMGPMQHAGEINPDRQKIEVVLSLLGQIIKTASLEDSGTSPEGKFSTLSSTQGRGMYALASAVSKLRGFQDLNFEDLIEKADQLYGLSSLENLDLNKNTVLIFPPAAGDPRWRSEYLVKAYREAGYNVLMYAFDPTQKATEIAEKFYKSMSSPFMKGIMLNRGVTIVGFSAARTYVDQTLLDYGNTGLFKKSTIYMASGNWGGSPKADVSRIPLGKVIRKIFVAGEFKNMVYGEDPNSDQQLSLLVHHSEIVSQVAEYHGTLGYMDKHMPNFSHWFETPTGKYPGTYLLWEAFNGSEEAYLTLKSFYANKKKYTTQSHFLEEVERLQMTYENIDIKQHKGNPYYETVHVAALLSPEGAARAVKATNRFYEKKPAVAVNHAMGTTTPSKFGGIDLTAANMNLQLRNAGEAIKFHLDPAMLQQLQNAPGFTPVIINIQPLNSLQKFLGISAAKDLASSS